VQPSAVLKHLSIHSSIHPSIHPSIYLYSCSSHLENKASVKRFLSLQFLNRRQSIWLLGRGISPSQSRYLTQTQNKCKQTSMPRVGFKLAIPMFERAKTFRALDGAATVIGLLWRHCAPYHTYWVCYVSLCLKCPYRDSNRTPSEHKSGALPLF
jgi:hypothetical protein